MIRRIVLAAASLALIGGAVALPAAAASASTNHCPLWANSVLYAHPHCYANEHL